MSSKEETDEMFFLERVRFQALLQLEEAVKKHLTSQFYNKILPKMIDEIKNQVIVEMVQSHDGFDLSIKLKEQK